MSKDETKKQSVMAELWDGYKSQVIPDTAGPIQLLECERCFYAGAWAYQQALNSIVDRLPDDEAAAAAVELLAAEVESKGRSLGAGMQ